MYVESLILFAIGIYNLITGDRLKRIIGLTTLLTAPNLLLVYVGAAIIVPIVLVVDTAIIVLFIVLQMLGE